MADLCACLPLVLAEHQRRASSFDVTVSVTRTELWSVDSHEGTEAHIHVVAEGEQAASTSNLSEMARDHKQRRGSLVNLPGLSDLEGDADVESDYSVITRR